MRSNKAILLPAFLGLASLTATAQTLEVTSTGINGTAIGATTPSTGSFTTLGTTTPDATYGLRVAGSTGRLRIQGYFDATAGTLVQSVNTAENAFQPLTVAATDVRIASSGLAGSVIGLFSSDGLAVTGTLGGTYTSAVSAGTSNTAPGSSNTATGAALDGVNGIVYGSRTGGASGVFNVNADAELVRMHRSGSLVGSIAVTTTATTYNTSSDARLKTNVRALTGSGAIVDALQPRLFDWKTGEKDSVGFVAQELFQVVPYAVSQGDDDPASITYQWGVDASKLVPVLTAEVKALRARVAVLEASAPATPPDLAQQVAELRREVAALKAAR